MKLDKMLVYMKKRDYREMICKDCGFRFSVPKEQKNVSCPSCGSKNVCPLKEYSDKNKL